MSDIFISYNNKDKSKAELFARAFELESWSVFWDKAIPPGKTFDQYIKEQLETTKCVVVLWSEGSVNSDWVKEEAQIGAQRKILVPIFINKVSPPLGFGRIEAAELFDWNGDTSDIEFQNLLKAIGSLISSPIAVKPNPDSTQKINIPASGTFDTKKTHSEDSGISVFTVSTQKIIKKILFSGVAASICLIILFSFSQNIRELRLSISEKSNENSTKDNYTSNTSDSDHKTRQTEPEVTQISQETNKTLSSFYYVCNLNPNGDNFLSLRENPMSNSSEIIRMETNTALTKLSEQGDWYKVQINDGKTGWAHKRWLCKMH